MNGHEPRPRSVKPWGAWQARCECGWVAPGADMSKEAAEGRHTLHVARVAGRLSAISGGRPVEVPILMNGAASAVDVERLMARLIGPASVLVLAWWALWCGGVL